MSDERWRPLRYREPDKHAEYDTLVEGVPQYLKQSLVDWLWANYFSEETNLGLYPSRRALQRVEVRIHKSIDWKHGERGAYDSLIAAFERNPELFLDVVDLALNDLDDRFPMRREIDRLDAMLSEGASAWMVAPDRRGLVQRVLPAAVEAARQVMQSGSRAGDYLAEAWRHAYGRAPNPSSAYREAVRAVEAAVCPVILPNDPAATLGKAIAALRDAPSGKYVTVFEDPPEARAIDIVRGTMSLIQRTQLDRHGTADNEVPLHVSQQQAEAALHVAVTLVQWFHRDLVSRAGA